MEHIDATITFSHRSTKINHYEVISHENESLIKINHYEELIQNWPIRSINSNNIADRLYLQRLVSVVKFIAERGLAFRNNENIGSPRNIFPANIKKKMRCF